MSTISEVGIGLRLGLSRPLAVVAKTSIAIAAIAQTKTVAVESTISEVSISLGLSISISRPLAVAIAKAITSPGWETVAVKATIAVPWLGLCLGLSFGVGTCCQAKNCNECLHFAC